jgi:hypothetical protein
MIPSVQRIFAAIDPISDRGTKGHFRIMYIHPYQRTTSESSVVGMRDGFLDFLVFVFCSNA